VDPARWTRRAKLVVRDHELALDVAQDVRIRLWKLGHRTEQECPWIHSALRKHSLFLLRCARRRNFHEVTAGRSRLEADSEHDPERVAMRGELRSAIHSAIAGLPVEFRTACSLRLEHELAYAEIAARLGVPVGTVRSRIARGKQLLQTRLAHWIADECLECALRVSGTSAGAAALGSRRPHVEATAAPLQATPTRPNEESIK
jgi:RNA polymerase sigma-70 factor (ECF subfamily)